MRFLFRILQTSQDRKVLLSTVRSLARSVGAQAKNPKWTSYGALETDVFSPSRADFDLLLTLMEPLGKIEFYSDLNVAQPNRSDEDSFEEARLLFDSERYWESHEVLEGKWRKLHGEEKSFVQGLILICAAFVHHQKGEEDVAFGIMDRAVRQLTIDRDEYHRINVASLKRNVQEILSKRKFVNFSI